jgi:predicted RNA-binding Zn-ribbon protein involved in translation (DUF1610 family)
MTHLCCTSCRLRFARSDDELVPCPLCGAAKISLDAESALGFRRHHAEVPETLAAAVALRLPDGLGT